MKNSVKSIICLIAALLFVLAFSGYNPKQKEQQNNHFNLNKSEKVVIKEKPFHSGMITIKLKEGIGELSQQKGAVTFNLPSLDQLANKYEVNLLEKRFKYNPNKLRAELPDLSRIYRIGFPEGKNVHIVAAAFSQDPNIEYAEPIPVIKPAEEPNDEMYLWQQHLPQIMAPAAWDIHHGEDGPEVVVAIVDDGIYWTHPDLTSNIWQNMGEDFDGDGRTIEFNGSAWVFDPGDINGIDDDGNGFTDDFIGWDMAGNNNNPSPAGSDTHGTHCAGIAAGVTNNEIGIASVSWNVKVMGVQISWTFLSNIYNGVIYAAENNADIISNSWGTAGYSEAYKEVVEYASGLGSIVVAAAHNYDNEFFIYPASYPQAISVASVAVTDVKASYSNFGVAIDISAPGGDAAIDGGILSTIVGGYASFNGTSMATPMVAGLMAMVKSYNPGWSKMDIIRQVIGTADYIDDLNPGYEYKLGSGRINAFRALDEIGVTFPAVLKIDLTDYLFFDENGNEIIEAGESVDFDFKFQNFSMYECDEIFTFTLVSDDPQISVTSGDYSTIIPTDDYFEVNDFFQVQIDEGATSHLADLKILIEGPVPIILGGEIEFRPIIAPDGLYIYDGNDLQIDLSGWFINDVAVDFGVPSIYTTIPPKGSLKGFDAVFLSFGNYGSNYIPFQDNLASGIYNYLLDGGNLYIEGGDALGYDQAGNDLLYACLGLTSVSDGVAAEKPVNHLDGQDGTLAEGMLFTQSSQSSNIWIDIFNPLNSDDVAFIESTVGNVGIQHTGSYGQNTFCFSYALASLADQNELSNRYRLLLNIFDSFKLPLEEAYLMADFRADTLFGIPPLEVQFNDWSLSDPDFPVNVWAWDFDNDGETDSWDEDPVWTYTESGCFCVKLIVSNGINTDTILKENYIDTKTIPFGTWYISQSPYLVSHDIVVPDGQTLTIEPGVEVIFTGHHRLEVLGCLLAEGTENDSIRFTASDSETGWHSIRLLADPSGNDTSRLTYCIIEHGKANGGSQNLDNNGGGILIWESNAIVSHSTICNNLASGMGAYPAVGGGIMIGQCNPTIRFCNIIHNESDAGGGISIISANPVIEKCLIADNIQSSGSTITREFGGIMCYASSGLFANNTISNNIGGGVGMLLDSDPTFVNTIFWGNDEGISHNIYLSSTSDDPNITYCDVEGGFEAIGGNGAGGNYNGLYENNIDNDPLFADPENGDYHLTEDSPCIDAGDPGEPLDPDGTISDIGAYYFDQLGTSIIEGDITSGNLMIFPNPVTSSAVIHYTLKQNQNVELVIYSFGGQLVSCLVNEFQLQGNHRITVEGRILKPGIYFCVLKTNNYIAGTRKMIVLK